MEKYITEQDLEHSRYSVMLNNMDSEALTKMKAEFPGRETQINTLYQVLFQDDVSN